MYIASVFAQLEREVIAERIRDNMIELAKTGKWLAGEPPIGYKRERYELVDVYEENENNVLEKKKKTACRIIEDEDTVDIAKLIFRKYLELKSLAKLEYYLYRNDIKSKNSKYFSASRLKAILSNPVYSTNSKEAVQYFTDRGITIYAEGKQANFDGNYGLIAFNKTKKNGETRPMEEWIVSVGLHKGIIEGLEWIRVQDLLEKNSEKRYRAKEKLGALLTGLIRCEVCNGYMRAKQTGKESKKNEKKKFYYTCLTKEKSGGTKCNATNVSGRVADELVMKKIKEIFVPDSEVYKELKKMTLEKSEYKEDDELELLHKEYQKNIEEINSLVQKLKYIDPSVVQYVNEELKRLNERNAEIKSKVEKLEKDDIINENNHIQEKKGAELILDIINNCFDTFDDFDIKFKKDILRIFIEEIRGSKNKLEVNLLNTKLDENRKRIFTDIKVDETFEQQEDGVIDENRGDVTKKVKVRHQIP